jgi:ribonucleoside-diphosphate reductase alpha chain
MAEAIKALVSAYLIGKPDPIFDFSDIRKKGASLVTSGGKAPGAEPLKDCIHNIRKILEEKKMEIS